LTDSTCVAKAKVMPLRDCARALLTSKATPELPDK